MYFDPNNHVVKRCAEGLRFEREGNTPVAWKTFGQAWEEATNEWEQYLAAHYLGSCQLNASDKLAWDITALQSALSTGNPALIENYPSLYVEIASCYEELHNPREACKYYQLAFSFAGNLSSDGYGKMIQEKINNGLERLSSYLQA